MSATLPSLILPIVGDTTGLTAAFNKATAATQQFGNRIGQSLTAAGSSFTKLGDSVKGLIGPMVAAAAAYASFSAAVSALNRADELGKASAMLGITVEGLERLQVAARQTGGSAEGMNTSLREMQKTIGEAALGEDKAVAALNRLGVSAADFKDMAPEDIFYSLADALAHTVNAQDRLKIAQEIFGRGSRDLGETLTVGSKTLREIGDSAQRYGMILSAQDNSKLKEANDAIEMMKVKLEATVSQTMVGFSESITWVSQQFVELTTVMTRTSTVSKILGGAFELIAAIAFDLVRTFDLAFTALGGAIHGLGAVIVELGKIIYVSVSVWGQWFWEAIKSAAAAFDWLWQGVRVGWNSFLSYFSESLISMSKSLGRFVRNAGELMVQYGVDGGNAIAELGIAIEDWGRVLPETTKKSGEEAKAIMKADVEIMGSTLSRLAGVRATAPEWLTGLGDYFQKNFAGAAQIFNEIVSKSSTADLVNKWFGLNEAIKETAAVMDSFKGPKGTVGISQKDIDKARTEWEAIQKEIASGNRQTLGAIGTPGEAQDKEYADKLAKLQAFNATVIGMEKEKQTAIEQLNAQHLVATSGLEISARQESLQRQIESSDLSLEARMKAYDSIIAMEDQKEMMRADAIRAFGEANALTEEQTQKQILFSHEQFENQRRQISESQASLRRAAEASVLGAMSSMFGAFAASMDQKQRGQFNMWKAFSIAQAVISTYLAASNAMATAGQFGPVAAIAATTMVVAAGLANVAKIAATQYGGGSSGGGGGGGGGGSNAAVAASSGGAGTNTGNVSNVKVNLYGSNFSADQVRGLIGAINNQAGDNMTLRTQVMS